MTYIRVLHAIPNGPNVDVYVDGNLIVEGLAYGRFTPYLPVEAGNYVVTVYQSGTGTNPLITEDISLSDKDVLTVATIGMVTDPSLYAIPDPDTGMEVGKAAVRFVHLSPNAPAVDLRLADGTVLFDNVSYKDYTAYMDMAPGSYIFEIVPTGTDQPVLIIPNVNLRGDRYYSIYAIGLVGMMPPLQVVIPLDGQSYINP